jgi:hypothetical protein
MLASALASSAMFLTSLLAQAEPAPEPAAAPAGTPAPPLDAPPPAPRNSVAVHARYARRVTDANDGAPASGFSLGATFEHRYAFIGGRFELGAGLDFFYDRFSSEGDDVALVPRALTQTSFALFQSVAAQVGPVRPWLAAGAGLTVAYFSGVSADDTHVTDSEVQPFARGAVGVDVDIAFRSALVVRADYTHPLNRPTFAGFPASPFGDLFDVGLGYLYRF